MPKYYKTTVLLKFNESLTDEGYFTYTRTETVTSTGNTLTESENAGLLQAALLVPPNPNEKVIFELNTMEINR